ncbi:uncharacterized protein MAM_07290 [Metarhizium album ARSEF 1941]|uniref:Uncharacterized protein n=1 Tax=Metarhizium album (strain ARSEF 1941) TaxID=1081103 RepID=A0A0B2WFX6_METAS|nr:uncharacterized protein MAM_07290 [Metarhizium album ARSEF 1941]KHN94871.1 hypothetical protein MAM_07290 [Metarhizium album ARSEF 1941]
MPLPSPELDEAWNRISIAGTGGLRNSRDDLSRLNKTADADITAGFGDGTDNVQVLLQVFHQLRCLNQIHKHTWPDYYTFKAPPNGDPAADFSTLHTCQNFSKIQKYVEDHAELWGVWALQQ